MKVDVFKKLIKEAVREVLREELSQVNPTQIQENRTMSFTTQDVDMVAYRQNLAANMGLTPPSQPKAQSPILMNKIEILNLNLTKQVRFKFKQKKYILKSN